MTDQIRMSGYLRIEDMLAARLKDMTRQRDEARAEGFAAGLEAAKEANRAAREAVIHSGARQYINGISDGHDRAHDAIRALDKTGTEHKENEK